MTKSQKLILVWAIIVTFLMSIFATAFGVLYTKTNITNSYIDSGSEITDGEGNDLTGGKVYDLPQKVVFRTRSIDGQSSEGVTVKAIITPDNATNKKVDWSVSWVNENSAWASGKNVYDYVDVIPTEDGALTADIFCYAEFGEQVQLTVTSRDNPNATDSAAIDFAKRITDLTVELRKGSATGDLISSTASTGKLTDNWGNTAMRYMVLVPVYSGVGTIEDNFTYTVKATLTEDMEFFMSVWDYGVAEYGEYKTSHEFNVNNACIDFLGGYDFFRYFVPTDYEGDLGATISMPRKDWENYMSNVFSFYEGNDAFIFEITATGAYSSLASKTVAMAYDMSTVSISVNDVQLSPDEIVL